MVVVKIVLLLLAATAGALFQEGPTPGSAPLNERVMVVYNANGKDSRAVAKYYLEKRNIPKENLCKIDTEVDQNTSPEQYESEVKKPIRSCLVKIGKQKILYIVMSYQAPYAVLVGDHLQAVDQLVSDIWDEYAGPRALGKETGNQPYFGEAQSEGNAYAPFVPFAKYRDQPSAKTIYSVWRLDGATANIARGLVDKAMYAESNGLKGKAYFDLGYPAVGSPDSGYGAGGWDIYRASEFARKAGFDITVDEKETEFGTAPSPLRCENAALYTGWYSLHHYNDAFGWVPGAIGFHLDSASATNPRLPDNWSGGALLKGITVTSGSVTEPFLEGLVHPDQIFLYLFQGANVGDAVLHSTRWLKWMILNFGDPLYRPFPDGAGPYTSASYHENWFALMPNALVGGGDASGALGLSGPVNKPVPITFKSSNPELVSLPNSGTIPVSGNGARFPIVAKPPKEVSNVIISVTVGSDTVENTLTLYPLLLNVKLSQPSIKGDGTATGTVALYVPARGEGLIVKLSSSNPEAIVPAVVKIPAGATNATFPISAKVVRAEVTATITAAIDGASTTAQLKITP
jgi:uncharacterized protein (TIGR03790 family)